MNTIRTNRIIRGLAYLLASLSLIFAVVTAGLTLHLASLGAYSRRPVADAELIYGTYAGRQFFEQQSREAFEAFYATTVFIPQQEALGRTIDSTWKQTMQQKLTDLQLPQNRSVSVTILDDHQASLWTNLTAQPVIMQNLRTETAPLPDLYYGAYGDHGYDLYESDNPHPEYYTIKVDLHQAYDPDNDGQAILYQAYQFLGQNRVVLAILPIVSLLVLLFCLTFLMKSAGLRKSSDVVHLTWYDRLPIDLSVLLHLGILLATVAIMNSLVRYDWSAEIYDFNYLAVSFAAFAICLTTLLGIRFLVSLAVRVKSGRFWQNSLVWMFCQTILRLIAHLPLLWKGLLAMAGLCILDLWLIIQMINRYQNPNGYGRSPTLYLLFWFLTRLILIVTASLLIIQMARLKTAGQHMAGGDLDYVVDESHLFGDLQEHGRNLNSIRSGIARAVDEQMKSERFKTELITNVSHDIKTPLTSIINYVDLMKKLQIEHPTAKEYLAVIDRQASRLKKLSEDIVDASKAATGNIQVDFQPIDLIELLAQTIEAFSERLTASKLNLISHLPGETCPLVTDGRLLWRVLDNLFQNVCKYAAPDSRVYLDVSEQAEYIVIVLRNISRDPLNYSSELLVERFIQGDRSRNTEGSGLGLAIAQSLTQLIKGEFKLDLDGDLFKVTILLPGNLPVPTTANQNPAVVIPEPAPL